MDDRSASRLAAYRSGRGAEYDDVTAARNVKIAESKQITQTPPT
jgi:hypothetical protein